jgi:hypothetical protein
MASPNPFSTEVWYYEDRSDGGYAWDVDYDLSFDGSRFTVDLGIELTGDDASPYLSIWETGIERIWNNQVVFADDTAQYPVVLDVHWVDPSSPQYPDQTVTVVSGEGRANMLTWYTADTDLWPTEGQEVAAHEVGHMLGNFDEYTGGATFQSYSTHRTLMADLSEILPTAYWAGIETAAESHGGVPLTVSQVGGAPIGQVRFATMAGDNSLRSSPADDDIDGEAGIDTVAFSGSRSEYTVQFLGSATLVSDTTANRDGNDRLVNIELVSFIDGTFSTRGASDEARAAARLYLAALARDADPDTLNIWTPALQDGTVSPEDMANALATSDEFAQRTGDVDNGGFVTEMYRNVLGYDPDPDGYDTWVATLDAGAGRGAVLASFASSDTVRAATDAHISGLIAGYGLVIG